MKIKVTENELNLIIHALAKASRGLKNDAYNPENAGDTKHIDALLKSSKKYDELGARLYVELINM